MGRFARSRGIYVEGDESVRGVYTINGITVENTITTRGKELILKHLAGHIADWASIVAVGVADAAPTVNDVRLGYELGRGTINVASVDTTTNRVLVKGTIPSDVIGQIREIGVYSSSEGVTSSIVPAPFSDFDVNALDSTGFTATDEGNRIGRGSALLTAASGATATGTINRVSFPMEGFDPADEIVLAYHNFANVSNVAVRLYTSSTGYFSHSFVPVGGYGFAVWTKGAMVANGDASWLNPVISISFDATAAGGEGRLALDGMTMYTVREEPNYGLVSRAVLATPQDKIFAPMDVEYAIEFSW